MTAAYATLAPRDRSSGDRRPAPALTPRTSSRATGGTLLRRSDRPIRGGAVDSRLVEPRQPVRRPAGRAHRRPPLPRRGGAARRGGPARRPRADADAASRRSTPSATSPSSSSPDPLRGLHAIAAAWRRRFDPLVIGITGSIAKTSTKEAVAGVLSGGCDAAHGGQPEQRGRPAADRAAARARARGRGPRDGHVRRRRDPRAGGDRAALDRDRDRGPAGPPVADRLARRDRGRQGRAGRGAARGRRRRRRDPQRR